MCVYDDVPLVYDHGNGSDRPLSYHHGNGRGGRLNDDACDHG